VAFATIGDLVDRVNPDEDALLDNIELAERLLDESADLIRAETGQDFAQATSTVVLYATGRRLLQLPQRPVVSITSVVSDEGAFTWPADTYRVTPDGQLERTRSVGGWCWWGPVTVTYVHGYATVPADIVRLNASLALTMLQDRAGVRSASLGSASVTFLRSASGEIATVTDDHRRILDRYRPLVAP